MICKAYRLCKTQYNQAEAYNGVGAALFPGRWNLINQHMVYTSDSPSLALLEMLVHNLLRSFPLYHIIPCSFDDSLVEVIDSTVLPNNWERLNAVDAGYLELQKIGGEWYFQGRSAVLRVPSAVMPIQCNYLLNPNHPDFSHITIGEPIPHIPDSRLSI